VEGVDFATLVEACEFYDTTIHYIRGVAKRIEEVAV